MVGYAKLLTDGGCGPLLPTPVIVERKYKVLFQNIIV